MELNNDRNLFGKNGGKKPIIIKSVTSCSIEQGAMDIARRIVKDKTLNDKKTAELIKATIQTYSNQCPMMQAVSIFITGMETGFALATSMIAKGDLDISIVTVDEKGGEK